MIDPQILTILNSAMIVIAAALVLYNTILNKQVHTAALKTLEVSEQTEKNTNSMKDALVASTRLASLAEGKAQGVTEGRAQGVLERNARK